MDTAKPLLSGLAATIVGTIGLALAAISVSLPPPWGFVAGLAGFLCATLAGLSARPPAAVEGKPVLQGAALAIVTTLGGLLVQFWALVPAGWPQSFALAAAALISWLTGHALPMLGSSPGVSAFVDASSTQVYGGARGAADVLTRAGR
jgi:hypothetical protein